MALITLDCGTYRLIFMFSVMTVSSVLAMHICAVRHRPFTALSLSFAVFHCCSPPFTALSLSFTAVHRLSPSDRRLSPRFTAFHRPCRRSMWKKRPSQPLPARYKRPTVAAQFGSAFWILAASQQYRDQRDAMVSGADWVDRLFSSAAHGRIAGLSQDCEVAGPGVGAIKAPPFRCATA